MCRIVITGAGGGIGNAVTQSLAARGHRIFATDLPSRLPQGGDSVIPFSMDVTSTESVEQARDAACSAMGGIDALMHAAGVFIRRPLLQMQEGEAEALFAVNFFGALRVSRIFGARMAESGGGHVVFIGSIAAVKGAPNAVAYAASKAAIAGAARTLAVELGPHRIRVNTIHPGFIDTDMLGEARTAMVGYVRFRLPCRRLGRAEEVAEAVTALIESSGEYWTGSEIVIDGGLSLT